MMNKKVQCIFIMLGVLLLPITVYSQQRKVDSLLNLLNKAKEDTTQLNIYEKILDACNFNDNLKYTGGGIELTDKLLAKITDDKERKIILRHKGSFLSYIADFYRSNGSNNIVKVVEYYNKSLKAYEEGGDKYNVARRLIDMGDAYLNEDLLTNALEYALKADSVSQKIGEKKTRSFALTEIAKIYDLQKNYEKAIEYGANALKLVQETKDSVHIAKGYSMLAGFYDDKGDSSKAFEYAFKLLNISQRMHFIPGVEYAYSSLGNFSIDFNNCPKAMEYMLKDLAICQEMKWTSVIAKCYDRIAKICRQTGNYDKALENHFKALSLYRQNRDSGGINTSLVRLGEVYGNHYKNYNLAKAYLDSAINNLKKSSSISILLVNAYHSLTKFDSITNSFKAEAEDYKQYVFYRDSLKSKLNSQSTVQMEMNHEFDIQQAADKAEQAQKDLQVAAEKKKQVIIIWAVIGGLLLVLIFSGLIFRSLRITRKQKDLIEKQKQLVEEKNKDILDSIMYAKRLQDAILPPLSIIKQYLPESFLLYKPKDIVAGDFYWMERSGNNILIAAADCTGHGVPGAMVSVVCSNALNRTVKEFKITDPGKILDKVRELVLETFEKSESNVQDGMDISLCCINTKTKEAQWSGAYNSLWYIQNGEIHEVPADKQPIGKHDKPQPFNTHNLNLQKGDVLYLYTDGYADQFGGPNGKKFKYKQMEELLLANAAKQMEEQKNILESTLNEWQGSLEQVDDILVMGIRI